MPAQWSGRWRWRIVYLRTLLDCERYSRLAPEDYPYDSACKPWGKLLEDSEEAQMAFLELIEIYHAKLEDDGSHKEHSWIRPPLRAGYAKPAPEPGSGAALRDREA